MNAWITSMWQPISIGVLSWFGGWIHHALYIRPNQLKIKANLPPVVKNGLQNVVDLVVPQIVDLADSEAQKILADVSAKVLPTVPTVTTAPTVTTPGA